MSCRASFRFWGRLQALAKGAGDLDYLFSGRPAIKDPLEALGVPHTEIDLIIVDRRSVGFDYRLQDGDRVAVYPFDLAPALAPLHHLSPPLPDPAAFILDVHLGRLARRLRLLGFDCRYRNDYQDRQIVELAAAEGLIVLTRDRGLLKQARVRQGYLLGSTVAGEQLIEVVRRYRLLPQLCPLSRCPNCNGLLQGVQKEKIRQQLPPQTARYYQYFQQCDRCQQLYWRGAHYARIVRWLQEVKRLAGEEGG